MDYKALGQRVSRLRKARGLKRKELASSTGLCESFIGHIERGTRVPSLETAKKLAETLDTGLDVLTYGL